MQSQGHLPQTEPLPRGGGQGDGEEEAGSWVIAEILPRKNVFVRPPIANLDVLFIVASTTQPTPSTLVLDKLSAIAADKGVQPVLIITKSDLAGAEKLQKAYALSPLPVVVADHVSGEGLDDIRGWIEGRLCAFCGNSGVGKSTLLNALLPDLSRETGSISRKLAGAGTPPGRWRSSRLSGALWQTRPALPAWTPPRLLHPEGEPAVRLPGVRGLHPPVPLHRLLPPQRGGLRRARGGGGGEISPTRYESYLAMYDEVKDIKDWEVR